MDKNQKLPKKSSLKKNYWLLSKTRCRCLVQVQYFRGTNFRGRNFRESTNSRNFCISRELTFANRAFQNISREKTFAFCWFILAFLQDLYDFLEKRLLKVVFLPLRSNKNGKISLQKSAYLVVNLSVFSGICFTIFTGILYRYYFQ